jgi:hypothetical protein
MTTNIRLATDLWLEAGPSSGGPHHHLELPDDLAEFFDAASREAEVVSLQLPNGTVLPRPLVACGASSGQRAGRWVLALPTARQGGPAYGGCVIRLTRDQDGPTSVYRLDVVEAGSAAVRDWDITARSSGNIGTIEGTNGRRFGYW